MWRGSSNLVGGVILVSAVLVWLSNQQTIAPVEKPVPQDVLESTADVTKLLNVQLVNISLPSPPAVQQAASSLPEPRTGIHLGWPKTLAARHRLRQVLHHCLGARLATLDQAGAVTHIEDNQSLEGFSQFARLVVVPQSPADAAWLERASGSVTVVRLIPKTIDQRIFNWLTHQEVDHENFLLEGEMQLKNDQLLATQLRLDKVQHTNSLILANVRACP